MNQAKWQAFASWVANFIKHSQLKSAGAAPVDVFEAIQESYKAFEKLCGHDFMDNKMIGIVFDHVTEVLIACAEDADNDPNNQRLAGQQGP